jgi:hypothetical protein
VTPHPAYPTHTDERCVCGGVAYWHGEAEGCDDCECPAFDEDRAYDEYVDRCLEEGRDWRIGSFA